MNGYNLIRNWYNFKFENPSKVKAIHSDMYCYLIDLWNRLGQKKEFGLPTSVTMEALQIGSFNTYKKTFDDLVNFGFIILVTESKNQHQSRIVALSNIDKATDTALDKAHIKATDNIDKQETIKQLTIEERKQGFLNSLKPYLVVYGKDMMNDFYLFWSETTLNNKKLKFELQKTFSIEHRLRSWKKLSVKFGNEYSVDNKPKFNPYG